MLAIVVAPVLLATTCPTGVSVSVQPPADPDAPPAFTLRHPTAQGSLASFEIRECADDGHRLWRIVPQAGPDTADPVHIVYGRVPAGYREDAPARPLERGGCYHALADPDTTGLPGIGVFRLLPTGRYVLGYPNDPPSPARRALGRAVTACVRGYRGARTAADSAAVDARAYVVADAPISCGFLRERWPDALHGTEPVGRPRGSGVVAVLPWIVLTVLAVLSPDL